MAGPTLQLNITAPGQKSVEGSVSAVIALAAALRDLPKASAELLKLQKALAGGTPAPSGLKGGGDDLKALVGEIKNIGAQLNTSFLSLEETIKKGWGKAAAAQAAGEAKVKSAAGASKGRTVTSTGAAGQPIEVPLAYFAKMQAGAAKLSAEARAEAAKQHQGYLAWLDSQIAANNAATAKLQSSYDKAIATLGAKTKQVMKAASMAGYVPAGPDWWAEQIAKQDKAAAQLQAAYDKSIAALEKKTKQVAKAATMPAYRPAGADWWAEQIAKQDKAAAQLQAAYDKSIAALEKKTAQVAKAATVPAYRPAGADWWEAKLAKEKASAKKYEDWIDSQIASNNAAQLRLQRADAAFVAASPKSQARSVLGARSQLDQGIAPDVVRDAFGGQALAAARGTNLADAYAAVHQATDRAGGAAQAAAPKFKLFSTSISDAHSAARGLASGFGAMYLTWGRLMPLLAGAALSHSFVQSLKVGADVRQDLETLRVLSQESADAVAGLEKQLVSLGQVGPYGPREVAEAMKVLSLAGLGAEQVSATIKPALDLAVVGQTTIEKSASALVAVGTAYGYQAEQFGLVGDTMAKAAAISMSSVDGMMESFRSASVVGQQYKVSLQDTATALALLANVGIRNSAAGTSIRQMYSELSGASSNTRRAMKQLGVEVLDTTTGGMKPLLTIVRDLNAALANKSPAAYQRAIQDMSNERGAKSLVALLEAYVAKAKEAGSTVPRELERIQQAIANAPGFAAISAAQLSATPQNQMKAVASGFQTALFEAFKSIEPTLMLLTARMKAAFASPEFRDGVASLASAVGNLAVLLVEHVNTIKAIVVAYALWKGASVGLLAVNVAVEAGTVLLHRNALASGTAAVAATAAATAAKTAWLSFLGPIGLAIGAATAAWGLYSIATAQASVGEYDAARVRNEVVLTSLSAEAERLDEVNGKLREKLGLEAIGSKRPVQDESAEKLEDEYRRAERNLAGKKASRDRVAKGGAVYESADAEVQRAQSVVDRLQREMYDYGRRIGEGVVAVTQKSQENARLVSAQSRVFGPDGIPEDAREKAAQSAREAQERAARDRKLRALQKQYTQEIALEEARGDIETKYLDMRHRQGYDSYAEHADKVDALAEQSASNRLKALVDFYRKARTLIFSSRGDVLEGTEQYAEFLENEDQKIFQRLDGQRKLALQRDLAPVENKVPQILSRNLPNIGGPVGSPWQLQLDAWQDSSKVLKESWDDLMGGFVERGRTMWAEWLDTGKLSFKSLGALVTQTFADITYKRFVAQPLSQFGNEVFDRLLKPVATVTADTTAAGAAADVRGAFSGLGDAAMTLSNRLGGLGQDFWKLFVQAGQGLALMLQTSGSSAAAGVGNFLSSMFGGGNTGDGLGSGSTGQFIPGTSEVPAYAKGGLFNNGVYAFANGTMLNSVIDTPHFFRFGGSKLGVAGEAGPEAIMPLTRGPGGDLGVRVHGNGGGQQAVSNTTVIIENHGNTQPEVQRTRQPDGSELVRVVLKATAKDISSGGVVRKSMQGVSGNRNLPRY